MDSLYTLAPVTGFIIYLISGGLILISLFYVITMSLTLVPKIIAPSVVLLAFSLMVFHASIDCLAAMSDRGGLRSRTGELLAVVPQWVRILLICLMIGLGIMEILITLRVSRTMVNHFSVGEALEKMPQGIVFFGKEGLIVQSNSTMDNLAYDLTGNVFVDGERFWEDIQENRIHNYSNMIPGDEPIITMEDGTSWMFRKSDLISPIGDITQMFATDITNEQRMVKELEEDNKELEKMNQRLREYSTLVDETVRQEELLAAKMRVHDEMGGDLISAKMLIENDDAPVTAEDVYTRWNQNLNLLISEAEMGDPGREEILRTGAKEVERFTKAAEYLGIDLQLIGEMPNDFDVIKLIGVGIQECMTNAIQHARADQMYVSIREKDDEYIVSYSNNGSPLKEPITEGGGLSIFRQQAEQYGAIIEYGSEKRFNLTLKIPKNRGGIEQILSSPRLSK